MSPYFTCSQIYVYSPAYKHSFPLFHSSGPRPELHLASPHCGWASSQKEIKVAMCQKWDNMAAQHHWEKGKEKFDLSMPMFFHIVNSELQNEENRTEKENKEEYGGQFCRRRKYWIRENIWFIWGEGDGERKGGNSDGEGKWTGKKRKREKRTTQPLARWGKAAQICSEIRNLNKKSQVGCRGWWLKMNQWKGGGALWGGWKWHLSHLGAHCDSSNIKFPPVNLKSPCEFFQFGWILPNLVILVILYQYLLWICSGTMSMSDQKASLKCWQHPMLTVFKRPVGIYNTAQEITLSLISVGQAFNDDSIHW